MKTVIKLLFLSLLAMPALAQLQTFKGDTAATTQATRVNIGVSSDGRAGQKGNTGRFRKFAFLDELNGLQTGGGVVLPSWIPQNDPGYETPGSVAAKIANQAVVQASRDQAQDAQIAGKLSASFATAQNSRDNDQDAQIASKLAASFATTQAQKDQAQDNAIAAKLSSSAVDTELNTTSTNPISNRAVTLGINGLAATVATNSNNIATNTAAITANTANITANTSAIAANTAAIATNSTNITANAVDIAANTAAIAAKTTNAVTATYNTLLGTATPVTVTLYRVTVDTNTGEKGWYIKDVDGDLYWLAAKKIN